MRIDPLKARWAAGLAGALLLCAPAAQAAAPPGPVRSERAALRRSLGPQAVLDVDRVTGTPRMLARLDGTLSGPADGAPESLARAYVRGHLDALGLTAADLDTLAPADVVRAPGGVTQVRWGQHADGIPVADGELRVTVTADGRVLSVLGSPVHAPTVDPRPVLDAGEAVRAVQSATGAFRALLRDRGPAGPTRATAYADGTTAALAVYHDRLAWDVTYQAGPAALYDAMVDADTGRLLRRDNLVKSAAGDASVFDNHPDAAVGGEARSVNFVALGWLAGGAATLDGPYAHVYSDLDGDDRPDAGEEIAGPDFTAAFTPFAGAACAAAAPCSWSGVTGSGTWAANRAQNGAQAFSLVNRFHDHLAAPPIGFSAAEGAFEGPSAVEVNTDDGAATGPNSAHVNNANLSTPRTGAPRMQMFLFGPPRFRSVNGGDDASIVYHEYTHGLSNRLITDALGAGALNSAQSGALGEAWSDWYAKDYLVAQYPALDAAAPGDVDMGAYTDAVPHALRTQGLDCPVGVALNCPGHGAAGAGGYSYGDFARILTGAEVHADGEIWAETLWDLRSALGSARAEALITQGMRLTPAEPSFLDARNAILAADTALFGGADRAALWEVFRARGMGFYAATSDAGDTRPLEDFTAPPAAGGPRGRLAGRVTDSQTGAPVAGATAAIGGLTAGPDALSATTGPDGAFTIPSAPAAGYANLVFDAPGYDRVRAQAVVVSGNATTQTDARLRRNWAAFSGGGRVTAGDDAYGALGCGTYNAIDQQLASGWSASKPAAGGASLVVALPEAVAVSGVGVDPGETCGDSAAAAAGGYQLAVSADGVTFGPPVRAGTFGSADRHRLNLLPVAAAGVRAVRLTLLGSQGASDFVDLSELAVYSGAPGAATVGQAVPDPVPAGAPPAGAPSAAPGEPAKPTFTLSASGKGGVRLTVVCHARCTLTGTLKVDARTARRLTLGASRIAGTVTRTVDPGTFRVTVKLSPKAKRGFRRAKLRSIKATLTGSAAYTASGVSATRSRHVRLTR